MGTYRVTDPNTGKVLRVTGSKPPTQEQAARIFAQVKPSSEQEPIPKEALQGQRAIAQKRVDILKPSLEGSQETAGFEGGGKEAKLFGFGKAMEALGTAASNIPADTAEMAKGIYNAVTSPVETATAVGNLGLGAIQKAIPGTQNKEQVFDNAVEALKKEYGSVEAINKRAIDKPVQFALDVATLLSGSGLAAKGAGAAVKAGTAGRAGQTLSELGGALTSAGRAVDPSSLPFKGAGVLAKQETVNSLAKTALNMPKSLGLEKIDNLAKFFMDNGLMISRKSLEFLDTEMNKIRGKIDNIVDAKTSQGILVKTDEVVEALDNLTAKAAKEGFELADVKIIQKMKKDFSDLNGEFLTPRQLQDLKVGYNKAFDSKLVDKFARARAKVRDTLRDDIKTKLEEMHPQLQGLNEKQGAMIELKKAIEERIIATEKQPIVPVRGLVAGGIAGSILGGSAGSGLAFGTTAAIIDKIVTSPALQIKVAKAINASNMALAKAGKLTPATMPLAQAGRLPREEKKQKRGAGLRSVLESEMKAVSQPGFNPNRLAEMIQ